MERLRSSIEELNVKVYNPVGLNILWPRYMAFMFVSVGFLWWRLGSSFSVAIQLEIEYYVRPLLNVLYSR